MKVIIGSIDLSRIDKSRIKEKNGKKYYDIKIMCNDDKDQFGNDVAIIEGQTKEERDAKAKVKYIGNGRTIFDKPKDSNTNVQQSDDLAF